jgi:CDP-diacylglycerol--glycerol-3-phosphate 3-phosphatidyltransferase
MNLPTWITVSRLLGVPLLLVLLQAPTATQRWWARAFLWWRRAPTGWMAT